MSGYVLSVIGTILLSSVLTAILPEGKTSGVIKGVARLVCVLAIVAPVLTFLQSKGIGGDTKKTSGIFHENVIEMDESFIEYYSETRVLQAEGALEAELQEKYGYSVTIHFDWAREKETYADKYLIEGIRILQVRIICNEPISEEAAREMAGYVAKNYCSEVLIE